MNWHYTSSWKSPASSWNFSTTLTQNFRTRRAHGMTGLLTCLMTQMFWSCIRTSMCRRVIAITILSGWEINLIWVEMRKANLWLAKRTSCVGRLKIGRHFNSGLRGKYIFPSNLHCLRDLGANRKRKSARIRFAGFRARIDGGCGLWPAFFCQHKTRWMNPAFRTLLSKSGVYFIFKLLQLAGSSSPWIQTWPLHFFKIL